MRNRLRILGGILTLVFTVSVAGAQNVTFPNDQREVDGFSALAIITTSENWLEIWRQPNDFDVKFDTPNTLLMEQTANIIVMFSNPMTEDGYANIFCDFQVEERDGSIQGSSDPTPCFTVKINGPIGNLYLAGFHLGFEGEGPADLGLHTFHIGVTDRIRDVRVPLTVSIEIVEAGS